MGPSEHPTAGRRSNPQIDPRDYQVLYEMERRLEEKFKDARTQAQDDIKAALAPVFPRLDTIDSSIEELKKRIAEGTEEFHDNKRRFDDHSDRINNATEIAKKAGKATVLVPALTSKKEGGWVVKLGEKILLPLIVSALSIPAGIWVMVQIKMIAWNDPTTTAITTPTKLTPP